MRTIKFRGKSLKGDWVYGFYTQGKWINPNTDEERERHLDFLPYCLIDKVIEKRGNARDLSTQAGNEIWTFPLEEYFCENIYYVIKYTIEKILSDYQVKCLLSSDSGIKLLEAKNNVDMSDDSHFNQTNIDILNGIVDEIYGDKTTAPVVQSNQLIEQLGVSSELMTLEEIETNTQYLAHKQVVEMHEREKWGDAYDRDGDGISDYGIYDEQRKQLLSMFKEKSNEIEKYLFAGKNVFLHDIDHPVLYSGFGEHSYYRCYEPFVSKLHDCGSRVTYNRNNRYLIDCLGKDGNSVKDGFFRSVSFLRYTEIACLLGVNRNELPSLFRDYISFRYLPYIGNSILDNVKPEFTALQYDYVSIHNRNYFVVTFPYCGHCHRRLYKKYMVSEDAVIVISSKTNRVIEILPKDEFQNKYVVTNNSKP